MVADSLPGELVVVANRLPVTWSPASGWVRAPGGLVTALEALVSAHEVAWFGSAAALGSDGRLPTWPHGHLHPVPLDDGLVESAVGKLANSTLWPALHGFTDRIRWSDAWWESYVEFNGRFADAVAASTGHGATVWVHDYHLLLLPAMLAERRRDVTIGLSLHTPVDRDALGDLPVAAELIEALAAPDVVGVQTTGDRAALLALAAGGGVNGADRVIVSPVSVDPGRLDAALNDPAADALVARLTGRRPDDRPARTLVVGVDRMDYTKSIAERFIALDHAFRHGWLDPEQVDVVQIAQPSRITLASYREVRLEVERLGHEIGSTWLRADGTSPLQVVTDAVERRVVVGLLANADVALVTPERDGMNLVAKEFSIVNERHAGVLVLSRGAGAADELGGSSVLVDGGDPDSVAHGLREAVDLDSDRRQRWATERATIVRRWTAADWSQAFCDRLAVRAHASA